MFKKMNPEIKKSWVEALRSGKYKQTKGRLRDTLSAEKTAFCCLGVLCNLHAIDHPDIAQTQTDPNKYLGEGGFPPKSVTDWADLDISQIFKHESYLGTLYCLNDMGVNFDEIADIIERDL